jgi:hypothetical protein
MTKCDSCGKVIRFLPSEKDKLTEYTTHTDGTRDERYIRVSVCTWCALREEGRVRWSFQRKSILRFRKIEDANQKPPKGFLIDLLVPPDRADDMLLELQKGFERWVPKYGARCARRMFITHSIGSIIRFWIDGILKRLDLLKFFASGG